MTFLLDAAMVRQAHHERLFINLTTNGFLLTSPQTALIISAHPELDEGYERL
ncbi:MAG: hypothetical protein PHF74_05430 [Dehalococcoidales bacterium]|nr:hypothetical protein [Dehalococcoidales bacterium]